MEDKKRDNLGIAAFAAALILGTGFLAFITVEDNARSAKAAPLSGLFDHPLLSTFNALAPNGFSIYRHSATGYTLMINGSPAGEIRLDGRDLFGLSTGECAWFTLKTEADHSLTIDEDIRQTSASGCLIRSP